MKAYKNIIFNIKKRHFINILLFLAFFLLGFTSNIFWQKDSVAPIVIVKPGIMGFQPVDGSSIGNNWSKSEVIPVCLTKKGISGYEPMEGSSIGNTWSSSEIIPVCLVKQSGNNFLPAIVDDVRNTDNQVETKNEQSPVLIITTISEIIQDSYGDNIFKLRNGQYWKQDSYAYIYSTYRFNKVYIFKIGYKWKMKIEDEDDLIEVIRIK